MRIRLVWVTLAAFVTFWLTATALSAPASTCEGLDAEKQSLYQGLLDSLHPYDCCDETISACLSQQPLCPLVPRLAKDVCRLVKQGKSQTEVEHAMLKRAQSMTPLGKAASFDLDESMLVGDADAPVTVVVYACARCPYCKVVVPALHREVTAGALKGKVKLYFRPFPLKDHPGSLEGGLAWLSAAKLGKFWPYLLKVYENFDAFKPEKLPLWAVELGMDQAAFEKHMNDPALKAALGESKKEGVRNRVNATPTLFISGRKYGYEMATDVLVDVLEEEAERLGGNAFRK
jgi:protein-disulfide isomerase